MTILWITDPWLTLDHKKDSSLRLMQEAFDMGVKQSWCDVRSIRLVDNQVYLDAREILSAEKEGQNPFHFALSSSKVKKPTDFKKLVYRTDPPVDLAYLHPLLLLDLSLRSSKTSQVVNPLETLLHLNEKMEATAIPGLMPKSVVSSQWEVLLSFGKKQSKTVLKPLHQAQSHGIDLLDWREDSDIRENQLKLQQATQGFQVPVIMQAYLEGISEGETRLWFLDGKLLASAKKLPLSGDFRVDIDRGSQLTPVQLNKKEKSQIPKISSHLKKKKIRLAAIDLIEGWVTDFNFTSPGLILQMEEVLGKNLARPIIKALLKN